LKAVRGAPARRRIVKGKRHFDAALDARETVIALGLAELPSFGTIAPSSFRLGRGRLILGRFGAAHDDPQSANGEWHRARAATALEERLAEAALELDVHGVRLVVPGFACWLNSNYAVAAPA
jgi:hypothetical protein